MELGLAGKAVVVTGGSKGIGLETVCIRTFGGPKRNRLFMAAGSSL